MLCDIDRADILDNVWFRRVQESSIALTILLNKLQLRSCKKIDRKSDPYDSSGP